MSYTVSDFVACPTIQRDLNQHFQLPVEPALVRTPMPFFEYVMSPANRGTLKQEVAPGDGKIKTVQLRYDVRMLESTVAANQTNPTCTASTIEGDRYTNYTIDSTRNFQVERKIDINTLIDRCQNNGDYYMSLLRRMIDVLVARVATQTAVEGYALAGSWGSDVSVTANQLIINTLKAGTVDDVAPFALQNIDIATKQSGYTLPYGVFGGITFDKYAKRMMAGCCNDNGIDLGEIQAMYGMSSSYDRRVASAMGGDNYSLVVMQNALQMLTFNLFEGTRGLNVIDSPTYTQRTINDPITGLPIDLVLNFSCGVLHIVMTACTKLVALPSDIFQHGDIYEGVNYVNMVKVTNT